MAFEILDRNFRTRWGELDIVACDGRHDRLLRGQDAGVANRAGRDPLESVHPRKQSQVRRMAGRWLTERERPRVRDLRFDAIGVTLAPDGELLRLDHLEGAF